MPAQGWKPLAAAFLLGAVTVAGFAPLYLFLLPLLTAAVLLLLGERSGSMRAAFKIGFAFGLGHFLAGVSWVYVSLHDFGSMPAPVAAGVTLLFCAYLALYPAAASAFALRVRSSWLRRCAAFPAAWVLGEWIRGWLFSGFPWLAIGYSQAPSSPLAGLAPILGVYGVGLALMVSAGLLLQALRPLSARRAHPLVILALLWIASAGLQAVTWTRPSGAPIAVALLQGNVPQSMKWRPEQVAATLTLYERMIRQTNAELIVLPETALPLFLQQVPADFLESAAEHARAHGADILLGLPERGRGDEYFNSVVSIGVSPTQVYRKSHLVPFGEFVPLRPLFGPVVAAMAIPLTDFSRGALDQRPLAIAGQRVAVNICYEDAFGEEIIRQLPEATLLVNVSNVAWFGDSIAPLQHLQIAQMRAIETGRPMLRATNSGMTAVVDASGHIVDAAETFRTEIVEAKVTGRTGATPYVRFGNAPVLLLAMSLLGLAAATALRRRPGTG
jgi:apolipoprotein N-acyltransferase